MDSSRPVDFWRLLARIYNAQDIVLFVNYHHCCFNGCNTQGTSIRL
jgi:hypothetical protein